MGKKSAGQLLAERRLAEKVVPICLRLDVLADIQVAEEELHKLRTGDDEGDPRLVDDPRVSELGDEIRRLEAIADEATLDVRFRAMLRNRWHKVLDDPANRKIDAESGRDIGPDLDKVMEAVAPVSVVEPQMSAAEIADLLEGLSEAQWGDVYQALWDLNRSDTTVGKSVLGSRARQTTGEKPKPDERLA